MPDRTRTWQRLAVHQRQLAGLHLRDLFRDEPDRAGKLHIRIDGLLVDFSKHRVNSETLSLLYELATACDVSGKIAALFGGEKINRSEDRPALHTLLRTPATYRQEVDGVDLAGAVHGERARLGTFVRRLHAGEIRGSSGASINRVINIGIGGSDLGPRLAVEALCAYHDTGIEVAHVSNLDPKDLALALAGCQAATTMIIVVSKSFTTLETRANADAAKAWFVSNGCDAAQHMIAVTSQRQAAIDYGALDEHIFYFWDWVGGRYSLWSSAGLSVAIAIGMDEFENLLAGAHLVDCHFRTQPVTQNIPVVLALLGIWYSNFFRAETHAIIPYDQSLRLLPEYLSQLVMESNGKSVSRGGEAIEYSTTPVVWGNIGTNAQHAFFQMLHQGTHLVPVDFLLPMCSDIDQQRQLKLVSNCLAQSQALMLGEENNSDLNRRFPGNTPSTTMVYDRLTPGVLGMLLAIYEHKTFVEAMLWDINPFDQWGVELGKKLAGRLIDDLADAALPADAHDASTLLLMQEYLQRNR